MIISPKMANPVPMMFQSNFFFGDPDQTAFGALPHVLGLEPEAPANLYNSNFQAGMGVWKSELPAPNLYDSFTEYDIEETAQSQNEIVQKILLVPSLKSYQQSEFFFIRTGTNPSVKAHYTSQTKFPYTAVALSDLPFESIKDRDGVEYRFEDLPVADVVKNFQPMGTFFAYVSESSGRESKIVAYALGGLCDILNVWHVHIIPGMTLYFLVYKREFDDGAGNFFFRTCLQPYAGLQRPLENKEIQAIIADETNVAILNVGVVCASNQKVALSTASVYDIQKFPAKGYKVLDPKEPGVNGNVLRIRMSCLKWELFYFRKPPAPAV